MKSVRLLTPYIPYPPDEGAFHVILNQIIFLAGQADRVEVLSWKNEPHDFENRVEAIRENFSVQNVVWRSMYNEVTHPARATRLIQSVFSPWASPELHYFPKLKRLPNLEEVDVEIFYYSFCAPWLADWPRKARKEVCLLFNIEVDLFREKLDAETRFAARQFHKKTIAKLKAHDRILEAFFDEFWCVSTKDQQSFEKIVTTKRVRTTPPNYDGWSATPPSHDQHAQIRLGFVGGLDFGPNYESANFIVNEVAPLLVGREQAMEIVIGGRRPPQDLIDRAAKYPFISILGYIDDIDEFWQGLDAFLIPHITGSGVRTKLLESLARRVPTLTNQAGFDRIDHTLKSVPYLHVLENPQQWADLIVSGALRAQRQNSLNLDFPAQLLGKNTMSFWSD